jgi:hypothetical protein
MIPALAAFMAGGGPPIALLDSWSLTGTDSGSPGSKSVAAGDNRLLLAYIGEESTSHEPTAVTYGGEAMTLAILRQSASGFPVSGSFWYLNDAGIAAASGTGFGVTFDGQFRMLAGSYANVGQSSPVVDTDSNIGDGSVAAALSMATADGGFGIAAWSESSSGASINASWSNVTELIEEDASSSYHSIAHAATDGSTLAPSLTSGGTVLRNVLAGLTLRPA